jgi:hypothetical protein
MAVDLVELTSIAKAFELPRSEERGNPTRWLTITPDEYPWAVVRREVASRPAGEGDTAPVLAFRWNEVRGDGIDCTEFADGDVLDLRRGLGLTVPADVERGHAVRVEIANGLISLVGEQQGILAIVPIAKLPAGWDGPDAVTFDGAVLSRVAASFRYRPRVRFGWADDEEDGRPWVTVTGGDLRLALRAEIADPRPRSHGSAADAAWAFHAKRDDLLIEAKRAIGVADARGLAPIVELGPEGTSLRVRPVLQFGAQLASGSLVSGRVDVRAAGVPQPLRCDARGLLRAVSGVMDLTCVLYVHPERKSSLLLDAASRNERALAPRFVLRHL